MERRWNPHAEPESVEEWAEKQCIERDILLLFHQLADYTYIMGDLYYGEVYALPYWEYLDATGLPSDERQFMRGGCLVMILAMAWGHIDGADDYIMQFLEQIRQRLESLDIQDQRGQRLLAAVRSAVAEAASERPDPGDRLTAESNWVHQEFVRGYFRRMVQSFEGGAP